MDFASQVGTETKVQSAEVDSNCDRVKLVENASHGNVETQEYKRPTSAKFDHIQPICENMKLSKGTGVREWSPGCSNNGLLEHCMSKKSVGKYQRTTPLVDMHTDGQAV